MDYFNVESNLEKPQGTSIMHTAVLSNAKHVYNSIQHTCAHTHTHVHIYAHIYTHTQKMKLYVFLAHMLISLRYDLFSVLFFVVLLWL